MQQSVTKHFTNVTAPKQLDLVDAAMSSKVDLKNTDEHKARGVGFLVGDNDQDDYNNPPRSAKWDPEEYKSAKKNLRKAMLEHCR